MYIVFLYVIIVVIIIFHYGYYRLLLIKWEIQDPKMKVLYHIRPYFVGIFPCIGLKNRPYIW